MADEDISWDGSTEQHRQSEWQVECVAGMLKGGAGVRECRAVQEEVLWGEVQLTGSAEGRWSGRVEALVGKFADTKAQTCEADLVWPWYITEEHGYYYYYT